MFDRFSGAQRNMVAGIALMDSDFNFVSSLNALAVRTGMSVHLVHVIEPWTAEYSNAFFPGEYTSSRVAEFAETKRIERAESKLKELATAFSPDVKCTFSVEVGSIVNALTQEANRQRASLITCSLIQGEPKFLPRVFSTPLNLMAEANVPVLIIPNETSLDFSDRHLRLLVCDNLEEASRSAIGTALELSLALKETDLIHLHVYPKPANDLKKWANDVLALMTEHRLPVNPGFSPEQVIENTEKEVKTKLALRLGFEKDLLETQGNGNYRQLVCFGEVDAEIHAVVKNESPDIVVFGRHHLIHKKPFAIGKVPFSAMLTVEKPILMVPSSLQLL